MKSLDVVLQAWSVGNGPDSEVVHMGQLVPAVLELNARAVNKSVFELRLIEVLSWSEELFKPLGT